MATIKTAIAATAVIAAKAQLVQMFLTPDSQDHSSSTRGYMLPCFYIIPLKAYYQGYWKGTKPSGKGQLFFENGNYYKGKFANGLPHDRKGLMVFPDGSIKRGNFKGGMLHGKGELIYKTNGMRYKGEWQFDKPHGKGK